MTAETLRRFRARLAAAFTYASPAGAADAMADATRWGWLPALSGVAVGAGHAHASHAETTGTGGGLPAWPRHCAGDGPMP